MPKKDEVMWVKLSGWLFILGIIIAIIAGLASNIVSYATVLLPVIGLIVGLLAIAGMGTLEKCDIQVFLLAVIALSTIGGYSFMSLDNLLQGMKVGTILTAVVQNIGMLVAPAAVLIALKAIWKSAQTKF